MRTIPTKEQVLEAAKRCPQTKEALEILFPEDFKVEFDWIDFRDYPFKYIQVENVSKIRLSDDLLAAYRSIGKPIDGGLWPYVNLYTLTRLLNYLNKYASED